MTPAAVRTCLSRVADPAATPSDAELLGRFAGSGDADAFTALVRRHGPVVLAVGRRVLGPSPDAEDVFQAVFLRLARRARSIRTPTALPAWLHRVALRTARRALARRRPCAPLTGEVTDPHDPFGGVAWRDLRRVLDEELDRLPDRYRGPLVLCLLDGCTRDEAAARLGCSVNTVRRRLDAGRDLLRARLLRRGVAPVGLAAAVLGPGGLRATVPDPLLAGTRATATGGAPVPARVVGLIRSGWRWSAGAVAVLAAVALGVAATVAVPTGLDRAYLIEPDLPSPAEAPAPRPAADPGPPLPRGSSARFGSLQYRVPGVVYATAGSPDGKLIATIGTPYGNPVRVYETATWRLVHEFPAEDPGSVYINGRTLTFSPDGRFLGCVKNGEAAYVWDVRAGTLVRQFAGPDPQRLRIEWSGCCGFTPDGQFILPGGSGVFFFDPKTGQRVRSVSGVSGGPGGPDTYPSPDGRLLAHVLSRGSVDSAHGRADVDIQDAVTGEKIHRLGGVWWHTYGSHGLAFAPDGKTLAIVPADGRGVELWDTGRWVRRKLLPAPGELFFSPSPGQAAGFGQDVGFTPDGRTLCLRLRNGDLARWDTATWTERPRLVAGTGPVPGWLYATTDGGTLLTPCGNGWVRVWDAATGRERPIPGRYGEDVWLTPAPDGRTVAAGDGSGRIDLLDAATGERVRTIRETGDPVKQLMFSPGGDLLAVGERGREELGKDPIRCGVRVLKVRNGTEVGWAGEPPSLRVWSADPLGFTPGGRGLVVNFYPRYVRVADVGRGELGPPVRPSHTPAVSPDGRILATNVTGDVVLVDMATGKELRRVEVEPEEKKTPRLSINYGFGWSADGRLLACTAPELRVAILDPRTGRVVRRFPAHPGPVVAVLPAVIKKLPEHLETVQLSADGWWAFTTGSRTAVGLWETATGLPVAILEQRSEANHGFFTPDGRGVVSFGRSGVGYRWDLRTVLAPDPKQSAEDGWRVAASTADAGAATRAAAGLVSTPAGRALLRMKLPPARADVTADRVAGWVGDLGSPDFATRELAEKELAARARFFEPMLRKAVDTTPSPEVKARLVRVLARTNETLAADELRAARVVRAAELVDGPESWALLRTWSGGAAGAVLTDDAKAALARLERQARP